MRGDEAVEAEAAQVVGDLPSGDRVGGEAEERGDVATEVTVG
jgi:hypothetical protein